MSTHSPPATHADANANANAPSTAIGALRGVALLADQRIQPGERWLYSAGFNVTPPISGSARVECELADLERLAAAGARVMILSHQGSHKDGSARELGFLAEHLQRRLGRSVRYIADPLAADTAAELEQLHPGELALLGNTRLLPGEEAGDPGLARQLAALGERVAVGGFSKAHRTHASNVGLLEFLPAYAAASLVRELSLLAPWAGSDQTRLSVAVLGGTKREKLECGLVSFADSYDLVIPGGAVLNTLLSARGFEIGGSSLGECGALRASARDLLERGSRARIHLPEQVVVARERRIESARIVPIAAGVPAGHEIVDFLLAPWALRLLARLAPGGRALLAGTPTLYGAGFRGASDVLLGALGAAGVQTLLLGGDTAAELPWNGTLSTGGGSALQFLAHGSLPVLDALARNGGER
jgi:phosphoglycerate kinase